MTVGKDKYELLIVRPGKVRQEGRLFRINPDDYAPLGMAYRDRVEGNDKFGFAPYHSVIVWGTRDRLIRKARKLAQRDQQRRYPEVVNL